MASGQARRRLRRRIQASEGQQRQLIRLPAAPKRFTHGTHRVCSPTATLDRFAPFATRMGITRIGMVTGLDAVGVPVAIAVRPLSRSVSVSQGKGITEAHAKASAFMEAAELYHAEQAADRVHVRSHADLAQARAVLDPGDLPLSTDRPFDTDARIPWVEGRDLLAGGQECWVPAELVHADFRVDHWPWPRFFLGGTNGLASGNAWAEAVCAALCEVVERDAVALWQAAPLACRMRRQVATDSLDDPVCRALLRRCAAAGLGVRVWDVTSDIGVACFVCDLAAPAGVSGAGRRFRGSGCHPDRSIALTRAVTEAAQTRLAYIVGAREDLAEADYQPAPGVEVAEALLDLYRTRSEPIAFAAVPHRQHRDLAWDCRWVLARLRRCGIARAVLVDLSLPEIGMDVVRLVVPGLEGASSHPDWRPGRRARRVRDGTPGSVPA